MTAPADFKLSKRRYLLGLGYAAEGSKYFKFWIIAAVLFAFLGPLALSRYAEIDLSTWFYAANVAKWFTAFVGGGFAAVLVPNMIASGLTRRELAVSLGVFGVLWSVLLGAVAIAGILSERWYYDMMGWSQGIDANGAISPIGTWGETFAFAAVFPLMYLVYFIAGTAIGIAAYRWEATGWLLLVPILPIVFSLDNALYNTAPFGPGWMGFLGRFMDEWGRGVVLAGLLLVAVGLAAAAYRILIDIPLRAKKA